ncbi:MAG: ATP-dependent RNA helicase SrmB [Succinivibrionaceae bacterium]|nr:ATP-dependent RNA helicase SrmB [Succinivibrionaceae bacterium]
MFEDFDLDEALLAAVAEAGYRKPTTVQSETIPEALMGRDIMAGAPTGTGKSAAFLLPCLQHLIDFPRRRKSGARILILTPTRELAIQIGEHARMLSSHCSFNIEYVIGGVGYEQQEKAFADGVDILVATPGRLMEYVRNHAFVGSTVEILVIDEADRMLDMGFIDDVGRISDAASRRSQTMLFSATLEGIGLEKFASAVLEDPVRINSEAPRSEKKKIPQYYYYADSLEHKNRLLASLLSRQEVSKAIVFVKSREQLAKLRSFLDSSGVGAVYLQGEMEQTKRLKAFEGFSSGEFRFMVATDVASRGLDVPDVSHVFNYDMPYSADVYVHRIGRTARAGKKGVAISLVEAHDFQKIASFERYTGEKIERRVIRELRPVTRMPEFNRKKRKKDSPKPEKRVKQRLRNALNKGKPDFSAKKARKEAENS